MIRPLILFLCIIQAFSALAQQDIRQSDSTEVLSEVIIKAYEYDRPLHEIPASVGFIGSKDLERFSNTSLLPAINTIPGVRMEERSPGSYRLAIRGSSLRSPFGVRNIKVYWNDLPFTDAGGNTYLNLFDLTSFQQAEVIKGPGTSLYGAGTGGVLMLKNTAPSGSGADFSFLGGSYGLIRYSAQAKSHSSASNIRVQYAHQEADGYREQTKMARDVFQAEANFLGNDHGSLSASVLYSDLLYQTPGALTKQQYDEDPRQARPAAGPNPGAVEQDATVFNKTFYSGLTYAYQWNDRWSNKTGVYGTVTQFSNPTIRNYERRAEQGFGGRTSTDFNFKTGKLTFGGEFQYGFSPVRTYANNQGDIGVLQTDDEITLSTYFGFAQAEFFLPADFFLTVGASLNKLQVDFSRYSDSPSFQASRDFDAVFSPRIALLKKINSNVSLHGSYSQGYSPPTVQELYPSTGFFDQSLNPEHGNNLELGVRADLLKKHLTVDLVLYSFQLKETIVIRRTDDGAEYFVNAGKTSQKGAELQIGWSPELNKGSVLSSFKTWGSLTLNDYTFKDYVKDNVSFDGNDLTGVAPTIYVVGVDATLAPGVYANVTYTYTDHIPLNDANTDYADSYALLGGRLGYRQAWGIVSLDVFGGIDNALDEKYSLGNDLNALNGRYYNAAPGVNYYGGLKLGIAFNKP